MLMRHYRTRAGASRASVAARHGGPQYRTLDNSDVNGFTYQAWAGSRRSRRLPQRPPLDRGGRRRQPERLPPLETSTVPATSRAAESKFDH
jgi:hypothetical protein